MHKPANRQTTSQSCRPKSLIPVHMEEIQNRRKLLLSRKHMHSSKKLQSSRKQTSVNFQSTATTFMRSNFVRHLRSSSEMRIANNVHVQDAFIDTSHKKPRMANDQIEDKDMIKSQKCLEMQKYLAKSQRSLKFLKKGTSVNRAIMYNVLKTKINDNLADSSASFINFQGNSALSKAIYDQVPKGLRDVIGPQQMLRMSNIFTGGNISSINLHKKVNGIVTKYNNLRREAEEQERMTQKSIKRW